MSHKAVSQPGDPKASPGLFIVVSVVIGSLVVLMYQFLGTSTAQVSHDSRSLWEWFRHVWTSEVFDASHGPLIPFVFLFLVYWNRKRIAAEPLGMNWQGMLGVGLALLLHWIGMRSAQPRLSVVSLILLLWSSVCVFIGWRRARHFIFPASILLFMIPFNFLEQPVSFPLRMLVTNCSVAIAKLFSIPIRQVGSQIFDVSGRFQYDVAAPCSGIRSLMTLLCIGAIFGYLTQKESWKRLILFFVAIPLAVLGNIVRVTLIIVVANWFGQEAGKWVHDPFGIVIFVFVLVSLFGVGSLLDLDHRKVWKRWSARFMAGKGKSP